MSIHVVERCSWLRGRRSGPAAGSDMIVTDARSAIQDRRMLSIDRQRGTIRDKDEKRLRLMK